MIRPPMFEFPAGGYAVVEKHQLADVTTRGARLVRVLENETVSEEYTEQELRKPNDNYGNSYPIDVRKVQRGPGNRFLVFWPDSVRDLTKELTEAQEIAQRLHHERHEEQREASGERARHQKAVDDLTREAEAARTLRIRTERELEELRARARKMEGDLGKIRESIGKQGLEKILGD